MSVQTQPRRLNARALLDLVVDRGSYLSWDSPVTYTEHSGAYEADLAAARKKTGEDESVLTGEGLVHGRRVALVVCEFGFLGGSIGVAAADRLTDAVERATREGLPLLAGPASGGTRMQEGTLAFLSMVKITAAVRRHKEAGLPYLVYLRHPTTGGVMASWGSLGHITVAEPGALLGFLGPRVYESLYGEPFPEGVQTAENLQARGLVDAVLPPEELAGTIHRALSMLLPGPADPVPEPASLTASPAVVPAWESITISRNRQRPGVRQLLHFAADDVLPLNGTGQGEKDPGLLLALARFGQTSCVVLGQDRQRGEEQPALGPASLREARRGMRLAEELNLPLLTVIDTAGAALSKEAEEGGLAGEIARCLNDLVGLACPTVSVLLGQGAGGGALALLPADRTVAAQHAWLSSLPPEGASAIVYRDTDHGAQMAQEQGVTVSALAAHGIVDHVVPEEPDAAAEAPAFCRRMGEAVEYELASLRTVPSAARLEQRTARFRKLGSAG
ncbi:acetyl-CoA carboxylase carboxyltransferase subunit alpha/beta [Arthrobacter gengyunqii]|uniref:Acetyl-CoA carboxylase carboxyltransferase subunit alpha/beta n=1 Tax=Arthrobacter gengyunqii TaxID=2886940 RepID=A0ABS8GHC3_9MICC|nr:acetyl-CoA carboxylase carboxyltransferase subunit alpha/beta [Arthrobacter gengyunqii]MCC3265397.1 acetyl-CoA carboxylase carboxyltransferase subunit alpha/beta [Arthrobacter gengyunqii]